MDGKTLAHRTCLARSDPKWIESDLSLVKRELYNAACNRILGGLLLLIGVLALMGFLTEGGQFVAVIAGAGLFIGTLVLIRSLVKIGEARRTMNTMTEDRYRRADWQLDNLQGQGLVAKKEFQKQKAQVLANL